MADAYCDIDRRQEVEQTGPRPGRATLPRLAFVHVPKTAGTAITSALSQIYGRLTLPANTTLDYPRHSAEKLKSFRFYKGHAYRRDYERLPGDTIRFTVLRDPVSRALSYFHHCRRADERGLGDPFMREASRLAKTGGPVEFIYSDSPFVIEQMRMGQMRQFLPDAEMRAIGHRQFLTRALRQAVVRDFVAELDRFAFVLTSECLALSFPLLLRALGLEAGAGVLARENVSVLSEGIDMADLRRALVDVNAAEFEAYAYVQRREQAWLARSLGPLLAARHG